MVTETETEVVDLDRYIILYIPIFWFLNEERFYCSSFFMIKNINQFLGTRFDYVK
jgi:hypothetical protein